MESIRRPGEAGRAKPADRLRLQAPPTSSGSKPSRPDRTVTMDVTVRSSRGVHPQSGGRGSEQNRRMACDCRHFQPRPDPSHHGLRPSVTVRSSRGSDLLRACPLCRPSNQRSVPLPPPSGLGAESGDETRGVGTIWSVRQPIFNTASEYTLIINTLQRQKRASGTTNALKPAIWGGIRRSSCGPLRERDRCPRRRRWPSDRFRPAWPCVRARSARPPAGRSP